MKRSPCSYKYEALTSSVRPLSAAARASQAYACRHVSAFSLFAQHCSRAPAPLPLRQRVARSRFIARRVLAAGMLAASLPAASPHAAAVAARPFRAATAAWAAPQVRPSVRAARCSAAAASGCGGGLPLCCGRPACLGRRLLTRRAAARAAAPQRGRVLFQPPERQAQAVAVRAGGRGAQRANHRAAAAARRRRAGRLFRPGCRRVARVRAAAGGRRERHQGGGHLGAGRVARGVLDALLCGCNLLQPPAGGRRRQPHDRRGGGAALFPSPGAHASHRCATLL